MHKLTFKNYHKQKYTLLRKICSGNTQWTTTHNSHKFRQMSGKTPMWGNPTREREILLLCFRKIQNSSKPTFPTQENTSQHQICPTEICLIFCAKIIPLYSLFHTSFSMPYSMSQLKEKNHTLSPKNHTAHCQRQSFDTM